MELPGWVYLIVGVIVSVFSALIYFFALKPDGSKNMAMALFFFIGMIFLIVGVIKTFFKKMDTQATAVTNAITSHVMAQQQRFQQAQKPTVTEQHVNRVEEQMNRIYAEQTATGKPQASQPQHPHTNQYARAHPFQGVNQVGHQSQAHHPAQHHTNTQQSAPQGIHQHYTIVACNKCGTKNYSTSNFCHGCGNRLR